MANVHIPSNSSFEDQVKQAVLSQFPYVKTTGFFRGSNIEISDLDTDEQGFAGGVNENKRYFIMGVHRMGSKRAVVGP